MSALVKWLIVTADDFGISAGVNRGIIEAHRDGILTSTSLLVNRPAAEQAAALARACPSLSVGLHLELDSNDPAGVAVPLERQLARFRELRGTAPTHVDSHHDVHRDPRIAPQVRAWARRLGVRVRGDPGVRHLPKFYGQWGGETHLDQVSVAGLLGLLDAELEPGVTELTCHPGYVCPELASSYTAEREAELRTLCDPGVRDALAGRGVRLVGFQDLPAVAAALLSVAERAP